MCVWHLYFLSGLWHLSVQKQVFEQHLYVGTFVDWDMRPFSSRVYIIESFYIFQSYCYVFQDDALL